MNLIGRLPRHGDADWGVRQPPVQLNNHDGFRVQMLHSDHGASGKAGRERPRVLIMEDEFIVALDLSDMAEDLGFCVDGPFATLAEGAEAVASHCPDAAILDVQLADGEVFPLADALMRLGVPIIFHSGHADNGRLLARYPDARSAGKPCPAELIASHLIQATSRHM